MGILPHSNITTYVSTTFFISPLQSTRMWRANNNCTHAASFLGSGREGMAVKQTEKNVGLLEYNLECYFICMWVICLLVCTSFYVSWPWRPEGDIGTLELESQMAVSHYMGAGGLTWVIWKNKHF